ncbi:permease-like cell division protein FtsX [Ureibacillus sp. FSL K6-8385]|uniref:Cell division protein FtsX n=1 Tax=Ureibacillus terrenus TaxID=118246 RepID=A0A540V3R9_9BACL|nr:permease-like cell division protein FtsX [Ureibacillus terrenus]MED3661789.1 permease-like cell division protein FtsX [Ureibacillus terrenus]TQE91395.1 ABC transporter permease [Ureibacillus terrenus]
MKYRTLQRHFRESLKSLSRNGWMSVASISAVTVTLLLVGIFALVMMNLNHFADNIENDVEIRVLIDIINEPEKMKAAEDKLIKQVKSLPEVAEVKYSSKEEELKILIENYGEDFSLYEQSNPLRNVLYVKAKDPQQTAELAKKIDKLDNTYDVIYGEEKVKNLFSFLNTGRNIGLVLILGLLFTAIFLIYNTIRITITARRDEIEIMKLVGATSSFVRTPFLFEGLWLGLFGSIIPIFVVSIVYHYVYNHLTPRIKGEMLQLLDVTPLVFQVNFILLALGIFIGVWGSFMSVRKFLRVY